MEKPSFNWVKILLFLAVFLGFTGCTDTKVIVRFNNATSGTLSGEYTVSWEVLGLENGNSGFKAPLPTTQAGWGAVTGTVNTLVLENFTSEESPDGLYCRVSLRFPNLRALEGLFVSLGHKLTVLENSGVYTWAFTPQAVDVTPWPEDLKTLVLGRFGDKTIQFEVFPFREIRSTSDGVITQDRKSIIYIKTLRTYLAQSNQEWRLIW